MDNHISYDAPRSCRSVVVATMDHRRGVFFGDAENTSGDHINLRRCRHLRYWSKEQEGLTSLAKYGPARGACVSPEADLEVRGPISVVMECTVEAVERWREAVWLDKGRPVVITTGDNRRGVFFGFAHDTDADDIELIGCQNVLYWPKEQRGFIGLARFGPLEGARVGPPADAKINGPITAVLECTEEAVKRWLAMPWSE